MVQVFLKTVSQAPVQLEVADHGTGEELYQLVSKHLKLAKDKIKVVHKGKTLPSGRADILALSPGDTLLAIPVRAPPSDDLVRAATAGSSARSADPDPDDDDVNHFKLPEDASRWERALASLLQNRFRLPDIVLVWVFIIRPWRLLMLMLFLGLAPVASRFDLGPVFIIGSIFVAIFTNLGSKREGEMSAYSIFNPGVQRLPGELDAGQMDQQLRAGHM